MVGYSPGRMEGEVVKAPRPLSQPDSTSGDKETYPLASGFSLHTPLSPPGELQSPLSGAWKCKKPGARPPGQEGPRFFWVLLSEGELRTQQGVCWSRLREGLPSSPSLSRLNLLPSLPPFCGWLNSGSGEACSYFLNQPTFFFFPFWHGAVS